MPNITDSFTTMILNGQPPKISGSPRKSWLVNYTVLSFIMNGQLYSEYKRIGHMIGIPTCSESQWQRIVQWLGKHVQRLADWSCEEVRKRIIERGDQEHWVASYDGYYLTRGHHSNNSSATLHDYTTGKIAWYTHRTKRGVGHNWEGTSNAAEADMFEEILAGVKNEGFNISEIINDKDSSLNSIFCQHFPEGTVTYCSNHSAKTFHKDLLKVRQSKCEVSTNTPVYIDM